MCCKPAVSVSKLRPARRCLACTRAVLFRVSGLMQGRTSLPTAVGLELDTYDRPGEILPALLVANEKSGFRLEMGAHFLCLTADNR